MATSGEMVAKVADLFEVHEATIESIDRVLSEAGMRTKGGRGRSAAIMSGADVVNLSIAVILGVGMKDAPGAVAKIIRMQRQNATLQWRPDPQKPLTLLDEQVGQYKLHPATAENLTEFPVAAALLDAKNIGEGLAALVNGMVAGEFEGAGDMMLNVQMTSIGPSATIFYATRAGILRVHYQTTGPEAERPVFERRFKLDEALIQRLAGVIRPA